MKQKSSRRVWGSAVALTLCCGAGFFWVRPVVLAQDAAQQISTNSESVQAALPGTQLLARDTKGQQIGICPLQKIAVTAQLGAQNGQTRVRQTFGNPFSEPIEAIYKFALPEGAAVNGLTIRVGKRTIKGEIKTTARARQIYDAAKRSGQVAALLDQSRPGSFSQSLANIAPGETIEVELSYFQSLEWKDGVAQWNFPLATGPRTAAPAATTPTPATSYDTNGENSEAAQNQDVPPVASEIVQSLAPDAASFDIEISAGVPVADVESPTHPIRATPGSGGVMRVQLAAGATIPNRDFVLNYRTAGGQISEALLRNSDARGDYFSLTLQPPARVAATATRPKELTWVVDRSGSMDGWPLEAARTLVTRNLDQMRAGDTFNVWSFSFGPEACFDHPVAATPANIAVAKRYLDSLDARGQTDMLPVVRAALRASQDSKRLRVVTFITDGYVDNDLEIVAAARQNAGSARVWAYGVGGAVNRVLLDGLALAGRGESEVVLKPDDAEKVADKFTQRLDAPVLTDISLDWNGLPVTDVFPRALPDLFASKPLTISGRFSAPATGFVTLRGQTANGPYERKIPIDASAPTKLAFNASASTGRNAPANPAVPALWARGAVADLLGQDLVGLQYDAFDPKLKSRVEQIGLDFDLVTPFTAFVAVDSQTRVKPARVTVEVPSAKVPGARDEAASPYAGASGPTSAASDARYAATSGGGFSGAAGDPLLRVKAPADARAVIAVLPDGTIRNLAFQPASASWEAHFDIPTYAADGFYRVQVVIVARDGARTRTALGFRVDNRAPIAMGGVRDDGAQWRLAIEADEQVDRAIALTPWGEKVALQRRGGSWFAAVDVPTEWRGKAANVTVFLTDNAHNRTEITLDQSK